MKDGEEETQGLTETSEESSKWVRLIREIEDGSMSLGEQAARFDRDRREFREQFQFNHDD